MSNSGQPSQSCKGRKEHRKSNRYSVGRRLSAQAALTLRPWSASVDMIWGSASFDATINDEQYRGQPGYLGFVFRQCSEHVNPGNALDAEADMIFKYSLLEQGKMAERSMACDSSESLPLLEVVFSWEYSRVQKKQNERSYGVERGDEEG
ncbi:hypothetical protein FA13DRAFT_1722178 [Coprinellus micaceus]|uniref:Uncharacterized protein n=1 Tax=Coprinellus micaceus TaxID=71717 RepID=A0A4Y7RPU4_COPMI|nr:hypothetical protein FA13DRAFT_1722178 [Coprinellus micaceus]